ncbi:YcgL domain-containing protein [Alteromonas sp. 14N.309.X.WAT.G.H12]
MYKTRKKAGMYLYVPGKEAFDEVPEVLMSQFGKPQLVMLVALDKHDTLAGIEKDVVKNSLIEKGFYLQMPPKEEDLLSVHRKAQGLSPYVDEKR